MSKRLLVAGLGIGGLVTLGAGAAAFVLATPALDDVHEMLAPALGLALLAALGTVGVAALVVLKGLHDVSRVGRRNQEIARKHYRSTREHKERSTSRHDELQRTLEEQARALDEVREALEGIIDQEGGLAADVEVIAAKIDEVLHDQRVNARTATEQIHDLVAELRATRRSS